MKQIFGSATHPDNTKTKGQMMTSKGGVAAKSLPAVTQGRRYDPAKARFKAVKPLDVYMPTPQQKAFLKRELEARRLPYRQIDNLKFVRGLDAQANKYTRIGYASGAGAVTQGSTVYVRPTKWDEVIGFRSPIPFEEAYHTPQFASDGGAGFYPHYLVNSGGGLLFTGDEYHGNVYEAFAQGASRRMFQNWQAENARRKAPTRRR